MYDIADDNMRRDEVKDDSDEECEILEEKWVNQPPADTDSFTPAINAILGASFISGRKRPAADSPNSPREATGFKQPALQVTNNEVEWTIPSPTPSQSLVQSSISPPGYLSMLGQSNQLLPPVLDSSMYQSHSCLIPQPIPSSVSIPNNAPQCTQSSSVQSCYVPMCGCNSLARPIPMRPSSLVASYYPAQSSSNSGEVPVNNGLDTKPPQQSSPPQQIHDCLTHPSQPFQTCVPSPFVRTQCVQTSTLLSNHLIATSSCTIPVNSSLPPQTNPPQEAFVQPQPSSQSNTISQSSQGHTSPTGNDSPVHGRQAALDLSSSLHGPSNPATVFEKRPIWQGNLHYEEKGLNATDPNVSHYLACTFSDMLRRDGDSDLDVNLWPSQMALSLIASEILKEKNMLEVLKSAAHHVNIDFHEESLALKRIKRNMNHGWMGCVQFTIPNDVRILIVLYMPQKNVFVGFIPHEQRIFFHTFRHVYEKKRRLRNEQKELQARMYRSGSQSSSSSVSTSIGLNEQTSSQFEEIDNEIDAHISALRHQEAQPSTSYQQPSASHSASNQSIEARLKRLEAAQSDNTRNVNEYEEIDNEINRQIAAHWMRHYSQEPTSTTPVHRHVSSPRPSKPYTFPTTLTLLDQLRKMKEGKTTPRNPYYVQPPKLTDATFRQYLMGLGAVSNGDTHTACLVAQSSPETTPSVDVNSVEAQASEIFGKDLVQKIVQKRLTATGKRFYTVEELCDEILKHEERKPKPLDEGPKKEVSEELLCKICLDQRLSIVFEPCGHLATCQECSQYLTKCPMCRTIVTKKMRIYM